MAKVIGSEAGGYATVAPTENYIGQALQNVEQNAFKYREEKREQEAKKAALAKAKQNALDKERDDEVNDLEKLSAIRAKDSGFSGIDSAVSNGLSSAREEYINYKRAYRKSGDKADLLKMSSALNKLYTISTIPDSYKKAVDGLRDGIGNGTVSRSEEKRIANFAKQIEQGYVVPKFGADNTMSFDVFERDENGQLSKEVIKNMKGEEVISNLTPGKRLDYNKHVKEVQGLAGDAVDIVKNGIKTHGVPDKEKYAETKAKELLTSPNLFDDIAQQYEIEEDEKTGYTPEQKAEVQNRYYNDILRGLNTGTQRDYSDEEMALKKRKENRLANPKTEKTKEKPFEAPVDLVTKGGKNTELGITIAKGDKILGATYEKGKSGPVQGVVLKPNGTYSFSIAERKNNTLNAQGIANEKAFYEDADNDGEEFEPAESDYKFSKSKPTEFTSTKNSNVISKYVRGMLNPSTGRYFQNFKEYKQYYDQFKPKDSAQVEAKQAKKTTPKTPAFDAEAYYKNYKAKKP